MPCHPLHRALSLIAAAAALVTSAGHQDWSPGPITRAGHQGWSPGLELAAGHGIAPAMRPLCTGLEGPFSAAEPSHDMLARAPRTARHTFKPASQLPLRQLQLSHTCYITRRKNAHP
eukprot:365988-Chlamydomonas_euryale.AAC.4